LGLSPPRAGAQDKLLVDDCSATFRLWRYGHGAVPAWIHVIGFSAAPLATGDLDGNGIGDLIGDFGSRTGIRSGR